MIHFPTNQRKTAQQSLLGVYFQALIYYDQIFSYFALIFQYFVFIYKYNILYYVSSTIAGQIIVLSILLLLNALRLYAARTGNKGKRYAWLALFLFLNILIIIGAIYVIALQTNALYLQVIIWIVEVVLSGLNFILAIIVLIVYRCTEQ